MCLPARLCGVDLTRRLFTLPTLELASVSPAGLEGFRQLLGPQLSGRLRFRNRRRRRRSRISGPKERRARRDIEHAWLGRERRFARIRVRARGGHDRHREAAADLHVIHVTPVIDIGGHKLIRRQDEDIVSIHARVHKRGFRGPRDIADWERAAFVTRGVRRRSGSARSFTRPLPLIHVHETIAVMRHQSIRCFEKQSPATLRQVTPNVRCRFIRLAHARRADGPRPIRVTGGADQLPCRRVKQIHLATASGTALARSGLPIIVVARQSPFRFKRQSRPVRCHPHGVRQGPIIFTAKGSFLTYPVGFIGFVSTMPADTVGAPVERRDELRVPFPVFVVVRIQAARVFA